MFLIISGFGIVDNLFCINIQRVVYLCNESLKYNVNSGENK